MDNFIVEIYFERAFILVMGSIDTMKYRLVLILRGQLSISIDKYQYFPLHESSKKISGNFEKILEENEKILK